MDLLAQNKVRERLRSAREVFATTFPLTEQLWLAWIADTLDDVAQGIVPPEDLLNLAERALHDYLSVSLWQQYLTCATPAPIAHVQHGRLQPRSMPWSVKYSTRAAAALRFAAVWNRNCSTAHSIQKSSAGLHSVGGPNTVA